MVVVSVTMVKVAKATPAQVKEARNTVLLLEERVEKLNQLLNHKIEDLYLDFLAKCAEDIEVFGHYLKIGVHHFFFILFELKILSTGRLHGPREEARYVDYLAPLNIKGSFEGQVFSGNDTERHCRLSKLSCDGIQYGVLKKVRNICTNICCYLLVVNVKLFT